MSENEQLPPSRTPIVAFFDVDNTLLRGASIFHIAKAARRARLITFRDIIRFGWHQATFLMVGENKSHLATVKDRGLELLSSYTEEDLRGLANEVYERDIEGRLWPETVELTREHLRKGHEVWLITATPQIIAQVISDRLGLTGGLGTVLTAHDGIFTGEIEGAVLHGARKAVVAREYAEGIGADLAECWAYSDSRNDIPLLTLVGNRVVVNPDAALTKHAKGAGWPILQLKRASIRAAARRVRQEAHATTGKGPAGKNPGKAKKR